MNGVDVVKHQLQSQNVLVLFLLKDIHAVLHVVPFTIPMLMVTGVLKTMTGVVCQLNAKLYNLS
jgi:hypothetical protein